jgi:hypothetical protein
MPDSNETLAVRPLPAGAVIDFAGEIGVVVRDFGESRLDVLVDGAVHPWYWRFEGETCRLVTDPAAELPADVVRALMARFDLAVYQAGIFDGVPEEERDLWFVAPLANETRFDVEKASDIVARTELEAMREAVRALELAALAANAVELA